MTVKSDLVEARNTLDAKNAELRAVLKEAGPDIDLSKVKAISGDDNVKIDWIRSTKKEVDDLGLKVETLTSTLKAHEVKDLENLDDDTDEGKRMKHLLANGGDAHGEKTIGELFTESAAYKHRTGSNGPQSVLPIKEVKTLFTTTAGWAPQTTRSGLVVPFATRPIQVTDIFPTVRTSQAAYVYMEETTFTNNAAETAEAGTYPESALALTQRSVPVQKVATFLPVTDEQLEDVDGIQSYIDTRLDFMLRQRIDSQLLVGDGTPPNLRGVNNAANIQTQALGGDVTADAIYKAMTLVRVTGRANPSGIIVHPTDWQDIKLLRDTTGQYIWGHPSSDAPDRIWGITVVQSDAQTLNTAIVGDFAGYSLLALRRDVEVQISNSHGTYFIEGKQAIRADVRMAAIYLRGTAFCKVTGI